MFTIISKLIGWVVGLLVTVLPSDPFTGVSLSGMDTGLGWLNWLVPIGDFITMMDIWLVGVAAWMLIKFFYGNVKTFIGAAIGGGN